MRCKWYIPGSSLQCSTAAHVLHPEFDTVVIWICLIYRTVYAHTYGALLGEHNVSNASLFNMHRTIQVHQGGVFILCVLYGVCDSSDTIKR